MSFFGSSKKAKVLLPAVEENLSGVFSTERGCAAEPRSAVDTSKVLVLQVYGLRNISKVGDPVISAQAVSVINFVGWPLAVHMQPCESVRFVKFAGHPDYDVAPSASSGSGAFGSSNRSSEGFPAAAHAPRENASLWVVGKQLAQALCGKINLSHMASVSGRWLEPGRVFSAAVARPSYQAAA